MKLSRLFFPALVATVLPQLACAEIVVRDDMGNTVRLAAPAKRIVSLAPHVTENLFAAGAGAQVVGASEYSDYPEAARKLAKVGGYSRLNLEAIVALKPDLIVGWSSGNAPAHLAKLQAMGIPLYLSQPKHLPDVASEIERLGQLAGSDAAAKSAAQTFRQRLEGLRGKYGSRPPVRTFYQIWNRPLMTVNGEHLISDVMHLCGGENVFAKLPQLAPAVTEEAVVASNPEAIIASGMGDSRPEWLDSWRRFKQTTAVSRDNLYFIPPELMQRHTSRILDGADKLCAQLEQVRSKRPK